MADKTDNKPDPAKAQQEAAEAAQAAQDAKAEAERQQREADLAKAKASAAKPPSARVASDDDEGDNIVTLKQASIIVHRNDLTGIPDTVFEHELPILRQLHGEDFVQVLKTEDVRVADFDANTEFSRLKRKYRNPNAADRDVVGMVYGNDPRRVAEAAGVKFTAGDVRKPKASTQKPGKKKVLGRKKR